MICILSLLVFSILGIFSVRYREMAARAFRCVFDRVRLQPCEAGFDEEMRGKVTASLMNYPRLAQAWRNHYQVISFVFVILLLASMYFAVEGVYNLVVHGTCTPANPERCTFG